MNRRYRAIAIGLSIAVFALAVFLLRTARRTHSIQLLQESHARGDTLQRMSALAATIDMASLWGSNEFYSRFHASGDRFSALVSKPEIDLVLKRANIDEYSNSLPNQYIDAWGHPFYIVIVSDPNKNSTHSGSALDVIYRIESTGPDKPFKNEQINDLKTSALLIRPSGNK